MAGVTLQALSSGILARTHDHAQTSGCCSGPYISLAALWRWRSSISQLPQQSWEELAAPSQAKDRHSFQGRVPL